MSWRRSRNRRLPRQEEPQQLGRHRPRRTRLSRLRRKPQTLPLRPKRTLSPGRRRLPQTPPPRLRRRMRGPDKRAPAPRLLPLPELRQVGLTRASLDNSHVLCSCDLANVKVVDEKDMTEILTGAMRHSQSCLVVLISRSLALPCFARRCSVVKHPLGFNMMPLFLLRHAKRRTTVKSTCVGSLCLCEALLALVLVCPCFRSSGTRWRSQKRTTDPVQQASVWNLGCAVCSLEDHLCRSALTAQMETAKLITDVFVREKVRCRHPAAAPSVSLLMCCRLDTSGADHQTREQSWRPWAFRERRQQELLSPL